MFEMRPPEFNPARSGITSFNPKAVPLFERALWQGRMRRMFARLTRRSWCLLLLGDVVSDDWVRGVDTSAALSVELDQIRGSINRCEDFDRSFYPLSDRLKTRWVRIASMTLQGAALPPVELIRVCDQFFVVDGHHRISVARVFDLAAVDAVITGSYD